MHEAHCFAAATPTVSKVMSFCIFTSSAWCTGTGELGACLVAASSSEEDLSREASLPFRVADCRCWLPARSLPPPRSLTSPGLSRPCCTGGLMGDNFLF